jgi:hypothetical protein
MDGNWTQKDLGVIKKDAIIDLSGAFLNAGPGYVLNVKFGTQDFIAQHK